MSGFKIIISLSIVLIIQRSFINGYCCLGKRPLSVCGYLAAITAKELKGLSTWENLQA